MCRVHRSVDPFVWRDPLVRAGMSPKQLRMMDEAKAFRLGDGYAVPVHSSIDVRVACVFASEHGDFEPASCKAMRRISIIAHEHVARLARLSDWRGEAPALSERERVCLGLYAQGLGDSEIAARLGIRLPTVRRHLDLAKQRLKVSSRPEALVRALLTRQIAPF
jgi:DNA-binding CsgD family transcriptional regulator